MKTAGVRLVAASAVAALVVLGGAPPAHARPDPAVAGPAVVSTDDTCPLRRIDRQLVRCDYLTGAGRLAPLWIPQLA